MSFYKWLMSQRRRDDEIGHIAREFDRVGWQAPGNAGLFAWHKYVWERVPQPEVIDALHFCWREYRHGIAPIRISKAKAAEWDALYEQRQGAQ